MVNWKKKKRAILKEEKVFLREEKVFLREIKFSNRYEWFKIEDFW